MSRITFLAGVMAVLGSIAVAAPLQPADILITDFANDAILQYSSNGTLRDSIPVADRPTGLALTAQGNLIISAWDATVRTYSPSGTLLNTKYPPAANPMGLDLAPNGAIGLASYTTSVLRADPITSAWTSNNLGSVGSSGTWAVAASASNWWVADLNNRLIKLGSNMAWLGTYAVPARPNDVAVDPTDGTVWVAAGNNTIYHYNTFTGSITDFFPVNTQYTGSVEVAVDGTIFVADANYSGYPGKHVSHYSRSGQLLSSFELPLSASPQFMVVVVPEPMTASVVACGASVLLSRRRRAS